MKNPMKIGLLQALGLVGYISLVSAFMFNAEKIFGGTDTVLAPVLILSLFVTSALICGLLVFGKAIVDYLEDKKVDMAVKKVLFTLMWMVCLVLLTMLVLVLV